MRSTFPFAIFLAATLASASSDVDEGFLDSLTEGEIHVFKRDALVTSRDIELALRDDVDLSHMYRHSMVKRDDGNHVTIWVANSYMEHEQDESESETPEIDDSGVELTKRQSARVQHTQSWAGGSTTIECRHGQTTYIGDTGPNAPYTGGANAIISWANSCSGRWRVASTNQRDLVVAGSNSGFNMRFTVRSTRNRDGSIDANMGCRDVGIITRNARNRFQRQRNGWRVRARGQAQCDIFGEACYKNNCQPTFGSQSIDWWIDNWSGRV